MSSYGCEDDEPDPYKVVKDDGENPHKYDFEDDKHDPHERISSDDRNP